jgi:hypothetical protein
LLGVSALLLVSSPSARADDKDASGAFDFGLSEMLAGRYATGCPALESSFRLDPRPGTLFTLADCDRKWGKTASALARFEEYLALYERMPPDSQARQRERASVAAAERSALERTVPLLSVRLPGDAPAGTRVWRDDVELTGPALSAMVPVDPGEHRIRVELPGGRAKEQRISIEGGEQRTLIVDLAGEAPQPGATPAAPPAPAPAPAPAPVAPAPSPPPGARASSHAGWTYVAAGTAAASFVVAGITGGIALSDKSTASPVCNAQGMCTTQQGVNAGNEAHTMANVETGALIVGAVAVVVTALLWWTEPRSGGPQASATHGAAVRWAPAGTLWVW